MDKDNAKSHLAAAFRWQAEAKTDWVAILASALGMAAPILLGAATGRFALGFGMAVGSLLVGGVGAGRSWRVRPALSLRRRRRRRSRHCGNACCAGGVRSRVFRAGNMRSA